MIKKATIDPRVITEPHHRRIVVHNRLTENLREYCALVLAGEECSDLETAILQAKLSRDGQHVSLLWRNLLRDLLLSDRLSVTENAHSTIEDRDDNGSSSAFPYVDVAVVCEETARSQNFFKQGSRNAAGVGPALTIADTVDQCEEIRKIKTFRRQTVYPSNASRSVIWREVFEPLTQVLALPRSARTGTLALDGAAEYREVVLLDKYLIQGTRRDGSWIGLQHVTWLLDNLFDALPASSTVEILAARPADAVRHRVLEAFKNTRYVPEQQDRLVIHELDERDFKVHDRHIRFGSAAAIKTTQGFDRLRSDRVTFRDGFGYQYIAGRSLDRLVHDENNIRKASQTLQFD